MTRFPVVLCILDGWGLRDENGGNAVRLARTPNYDFIMSRYPTTRLTAHGPEVGLPVGQIGNSEVGHLNIGAGRIVEMELQKINRICSSGELGKQAGIGRFVEAVGRSGGTAHVLGVLSDGGVHAHVDHMIATVEVLSEAEIPTVVHAFTDGRDVAPMSAGKSLERLLACLTGMPGEPSPDDLPASPRIATISGRYFAMDRDHRWERTRAAFRAMVHGDAPHHETPDSVIAGAYSDDVTDEFIRPAVVGNFGGMASGDGLICVNFRADRVRQLLASIGARSFDHFETGIRPGLSAMTGFVSYSDAHDEFMDSVFEKDALPGTLGQRISEAGLSQVRIAETEKYPHVTYFLNGGNEIPFPGEDRRLIPSPRVPTYDLQPDMSAREVTAAVIDVLSARSHEFLVVNYANPDMVGHTGNLDAAIRACAAVDRGLGDIVRSLADAGGVMILTADHGNCEVMIDQVTGGPHTAHTTNPVPLAVIGSRSGIELRCGGRLADVAPTLLELGGLEPAAGMTGQSLLNRT
ncbi:MAG: 2,3-bisphosphoglycerate-independent phosphoglycerate mutase [Rhodobacteraceae bacterium]|nr:2,3-bisphosphoglycerate-independent phosphoglycerate mutase [Paracoccaceae bacterium]